MCLDQCAWNLYWPSSFEPKDNSSKKNCDDTSAQGFLSIRSRECGPSTVATGNNSSKTILQTAVQSFKPSVIVNFHLPNSFEEKDYSPKICKGTSAQSLVSKFYWPITAGTKDTGQREVPVKVKKKSAERKPPVKRCRKARAIRIKKSVVVDKPRIPLHIDNLKRKYFNRKVKYQQEQYFDALEYQPGAAPKPQIHLMINVGSMFSPGSIPECTRTYIVGSTKKMTTHIANVITKTVFNLMEKLKRRR